MTAQTRTEFIAAGLAAAASSALPAFAQSSDPTTLTLMEASELVRRRAISPVELTEACLARIERAVRTSPSKLRRCGADAILRKPDCRRGQGGRGGVWNAEIYAYHEPWITKTPELYQPPTRGLIDGAGKASALTYAQARRHVDLVRWEIRKVFATVDGLITPTQRGVAQPIAPPPTGGRGAGPAPGAGGGGLVNTAAFDIYGLPTITVPCGLSSSGLQISGDHFAESTVLALAHAYEQATEWHRRRPALT